MPSTAVKPLTFYTDGTSTQSLVQRYGPRLEQIPRHDKYNLLMLVACIGEAHTNPTYDFDLETDRYPAISAHEEHSIWLDTDQEVIFELIDELGGGELLGLAQFLVIDLKTTRD